VTPRPVRCLGTGEESRRTAKSQKEKGPEARRPREFDSKKGLLLIFKREKK
jgi:hypothetical protein